MNATLAMPRVSPKRCAKLEFALELRSRRRLVAAMAYLLLPAQVLAQACPPMPGSALTLQVNTTSDGLNAVACTNQTPNKCTLREAIQEANGMTGATIAVPAGTYTLTVLPSGADNNATGDLNILSSMALKGQAGTIIQAGPNLATGVDRVFHVSSVGEVQISNVTIQFGQTNSASGSASQGGGGILFDGFGPLCVTASSIQYNSAIGQTTGGGIADISTGTLYLNQVEISQNSAGNNGGGLEALQSGAVYISNSRIDHNIASGSGTGGGLDATPTSAAPLGPIQFTNRLVSQNSAAGSGGAGISVWGGSLVIQGSQITSNVLAPGGTGAGLFVAGSSNVTISQSKFALNVNGALQGNGFNQGGAMFLDTAGSISIANTEVSGNQVIAGSNGSIIEADAAGVFASGATNLVLATVTISNNSASANAGNKSLGGGLLVNDVPVVSMTDSTVSGNRTTDRAGGILNTGSSLTLNNVTIDDNQTAIAGAGFLIDGGSISATDSKITNNSVAANGTCGGGGYVVGASTVSISLSTIGNNTAPNGGGLCLQGTLPVTLVNDTLSNNAATGGSGQGGAILVEGVNNTTLTSSTLSNNSASQGAGISGSGLTILNATLAGNTPGAGFAFGEGNASTVSFSTISGNAIGIAPAGSTAQLSLTGTIVANNTTDCQSAAQATLVGYNLFGSQSCGSQGGVGNQFNADPQLGPLQNNGGPTATMLPLAGSPAIDAVDPTVCPPPATDQRGVTRPQGPRCDIGAVEAQPQQSPPVVSATVTVFQFPNNQPFNASSIGVIFTVPGLNPQAPTQVLTTYAFPPGVYTLTSKPCGDPSIPITATLSSVWQADGYQFVGASGGGLGGSVPIASCPATLFVEPPGVVSGGGGEFALMIFLTLTLIWFLGAAYRRYWRLRRP